MGLYIFGVISILSIFLIVKKVSWHKSQEEINALKEEIEKIKNSKEEELKSLRSDIDTLQKLRKEEIEKLNDRLNNSSNLYIQRAEFADIVISSAWKEISELCNKEFAFLEIPYQYVNMIWKKDSPKEAIKRRFAEAIDEQYKYRYIVCLYPELKELFFGSSVYGESKIDTKVSLGGRLISLYDVVSMIQKEKKLAEELIYLKNRLAFFESTKSNLTAIPYMAGIMADYETYGLEHLAKELDWGYDMKRANKVKSIREIRRDARMMVEKYKEAEYQLEYLLVLYPNLADVIECDFKKLPISRLDEISDYDAARDYLSKEEYSALDRITRNQLALDRYKKSRNKTKWQIGRDYEMYVGFKYAQNGYEINYFGSYMGMEDLGRDLIAKKDGKTLIIQCKYWSTNKKIHEKHINQLYGTTVCYCIENNLKHSDVQGVLVTNTTLSDTAKKMAKYLGIIYIEDYETGDYPCIKCNIGHGEMGESRIYHLPFDQQYDATKITKKGEFYAMTVAEAEAAGFRRAFKWFGNH